MSDPKVHQTTHPDDVDEFLHGIWWVSDGVGGLRDASLGECATEIKRLRASVKAIVSVVNAPFGSEEMFDAVNRAREILSNG